MSATDTDPDLYLLSLPGPLTPVVPVHRIAPIHADRNACYRDAIWPLAPLTANPSEVTTSIHWRRCPPELREDLRLLAWNLINGELRPTHLKERAVRTRARLSARRVATTIGCWMHLATWLVDRGITDLGTCDSRVLHDYGLHLGVKYTNRAEVQKMLAALTRLWAFDQLSARPTGIGRPPWDEFGADDYLPPATSTGGENSTEPLAEQTMGPLLIWAIRFVDDLADDILAAEAERGRLLDAIRTNTATPAGQKALRAYLDPLINAGTPLPATMRRGGFRLARQYICGITGASRRQLARFAESRDLAAAATARPGPCPLDSPVTGRIAGHTWRERIDFAESPTLTGHLVTACFIVIAYLTGMRPGEILGLRTGCCPDPEQAPDETRGRHLIRGRTYKNATNDDGDHESAGTERDVPWVAIAPVVHAIRVLERIVPEGHLLFDHDTHDVHGRRSDTGSVKKPVLARRIEEFIAWANIEATRHCLTAEAIPPDPHGSIGTARFRRTLAWHIARRPGGLVALAIQYGHLRTPLVSGGYASRSRGGIHELLDIETVRAVADTVTELHDDLESGTGISGPAARRAIKAATHAPRFAGTTITATTARRLLANEDAVIYDNPQALLLCHYKRDQALCHRDSDTATPALDRCIPGCGNAARTDQHAHQLRERAILLDQRATHTPQPVSDRLRTSAATLRSFADTHDQGRITLREYAG